MSDSNMNYSDTPERLQEFLEGVSDELDSDMPPERIARQIEAGYGFDVTEVSPDDADQFVDAIDDGDIDAACDVLDEYDVPPDAIKRFRQEIGELVAEGNESAGDVAENGHEATEGIDTDASPDGADGAVSRQEVRQMIQDETPDAQDIAAELKSQMGGNSGGSGGGGGGGQQQGDGMSTQQEMALRLAMEHLGSSGGGQMAEMGEKATERVMERTMERLAEPSFGEKIGKAIEEKAAAQVANDVIGDMDMTDGDDDDSGGGLISWRNKDGN